MEFNELIDDFASRHKVADLLVVNSAASLDIDGIIIIIVANGDMLTLSAEIGEPPAEGEATFSNLLLEANTQSGICFAKSPDSGPYLILRRLLLSVLDGATFDSELEAFVNNAETWRRLLADFRPMAKASAKLSESGEGSPKFGADNFMKV